MSAHHFFEQRILRMRKEEEERARLRAFLEEQRLQQERNEREWRRFSPGAANASSPAEPLAARSPFGMLTDEEIRRQVDSEGLLPPRSLASIPPPAYSSPAPTDHGSPGTPRTGRSLDRERRLHETAGTQAQAVFLDMAVSAHPLDDLPGSPPPSPPPPPPPPRSRARSPDSARAAAPQTSAGLSPPRPARDPAPPRSPSRRRTITNRQHHEPTMRKVLDFLVGSQVRRLFQSMDSVTDAEEASSLAEAEETSHCDPTPLSQRHPQLGRQWAPSVREALDEQVAELQQWRESQREAERSEEERLLQADLAREREQELEAARQEQRRVEQERRLLEETLQERAAEEARLRELETLEEKRVQQEEEAILRRRREEEARRLAAIPQPESPTFLGLPGLGRAEQAGAAVEPITAAPSALGQTSEERRRVLDEAVRRLLRRHADLQLKHPVLFAEVVKELIDEMSAIALPDPSD